MKILSNEIEVFRKSLLTQWRFFKKLQGPSGNFFEIRSNCVEVFGESSDPEWRISGKEPEEIWDLLE